MEARQAQVVDSATRRRAGTVTRWESAQAGRPPDGGGWTAVKVSGWGGYNRVLGGDDYLKRSGRQQIRHRERTFLPHLAQLTRLREGGCVIATVVAARGVRGSRRLLHLRAMFAIRHCVRANAQGQRSAQEG
jgi:hypothetical protein